jgi:3-oxoadipate enol-lactonase
MRFRLSNGLGLGYRTSGAGRVIVLLHPIGMRAEFWDDLGAYLSDQYRCIAIDLRGCGESDTPHAKFSLDDLADDVIELLRAQSIRDSVLVGCSMGGMVAQGMVLKAPDLFSGMVLNGTSSEQTAESRKVPLQRAEAALKGMTPLIEETLTRWFPRDFLIDNGPAVRRVRAWLQEFDPVIFSWGWEAIAGLAYGSRLRQVSVPTCLIRGAKDPGGQTMPEMAQIMPRGRFMELPEGGHFAPMQLPGPFSEMLRAFIATEIDT